MNLNSDIKNLKGIGEKSAMLFHKLGIYSLYDLITYYPRDYHSHHEVASIKDIEEAIRTGDEIALKLSLKNKPTLKYYGKKKVVSAVGQSPDGEVALSWYGATYIAKALNAGDTYIFFGKPGRKGAIYTMIQPKFLKEADYKKLTMGLEPIYCVTKGLSGKGIANAVKNALDLTGSLPEYLSKDEGYMDINDAIRIMHFPDSLDNVIKARKRLVFHEFVSFIAMVRSAKEGEARLENDKVCIEMAHTKRLIESLPYKLTGAQLRCFEEILADMSGPYLMNRLVQGDVGSGKTIVALLSMLTAVKNGYQAAIMAPTEVLARQHMQTISDLLKPYDVTCVCLTGSNTAKEKRQIKEMIASGEAELIIGTHALIQDGVSFKNLGLAVTDEQHRFGVRQREALGANTHILVMSATPIPRTLGIILYGDLDISIIDEKPAMRLPIKNCVVGPNFRMKAYQFIEKEVRDKHQALVVCPMVEESEGLEAENVIDYTQKLRENLPGDFNIDYLHGRMKNSEKNEIMNRFATGDIDVLVSTTVIEVGINVPNTTVMMVENAERFGLSQLHQLRGRVGRGKDQSYCIFMCGKESKDALNKLDILNRSNDGFKIAEEDLAQRGPGDMFGVRQSGDISFKIGDILTDADILKAASDYVKENPEKLVNIRALGTNIVL